MNCRRFVILSTLVALLVLHVPGTGVGGGAAVVYAASETLADRTVTNVTATHSDGVEVAIDNRGPSQADIAIAKAADPPSVPEPGSAVTFTVVVTNTGVESVTLTSLLDVPYGDLADSSNAEIWNSTCVTGGLIAPAGDAYACSFQAGVAGNAGTLHTDTVTATVQDDEGNAASADAGAGVHVTDVEPTVEVAKAAAPPSVPEPGGVVTFTAVVTNTGVESVTLTSLLDVPYGDLADPSNAEIWNSTCVTGGLIAPAGDAYACSFQAGVAGNAGTLHTDTVTATVRDDEDNAVEASGGATVAITDVGPSISVTKTADPTVIRAGDRVDFSIRVYNRSVEAVTLINLDDTIFGDLATECGLPAGIAVGEFFECVINRPINADHTNTVTATAEDDEGNEATDSADASVDVIGPAIRVVKAASVYTATVGETITYTYVVENAGDARLTDVSASDDRLGAIRLTRATLAPGEITTGTAVYLVDESDLPGPLTNTVAVTGTPPVGDDVTDTDVATVYVEPAIRLVYLPLVLNHYVPPAPDLVVEQIMVTGSDVQVVIKNQGDVSVLPEDAFWVDLYVDPHPVPTGVNQTWAHLCDEGIVWGVESPALPLEPGSTLTLTMGDAYYSEKYSHFSGSFAAGTPIYVQVDSANTETTYGAVLEGHEMAGGPYNNVSGPVFPALTAAGAEPAQAERPAVGDHPRAPSRHLPPRP